MSGFIEDYILNIFLCLPVETLLRFRCISTSFCLEIDSPAFINAHLNRSRRTKTRLKLLFGRDVERDMYAADFYKGRMGSAIRLNNNLWKFKKNQKGFSTHIRGLCNGLILLYNIDYDRHCDELSLWNPFTRRYKKLPVFPGPYSIDFNPVFGLGYDFINDDYKVVRIQKYVGNDHPVEIWIFSLASNNWRRLETTFQDEKLNSIYNPGVFALGALHWLSQKNRRLEIVTFDISNEVFLQVFPSIQPPLSSHHSTFSLEVLKPGQLFLCGKYHKGIILFKMLKRGERFVLKKLRNISVEAKIIPGFRMDYPFYVKLLSMDGDKILLYQSSFEGFSQYDIKKRSYKKVEILGVPHFYCYNEYFFCWESLVSVGADSELLV